MNQLWKKQIATGLLIAASLMAPSSYAAQKLSTGDDAAIAAGATAVVAAGAGGAYLATRPKPGFAADNLSRTPAPDGSNLRPSADTPNNPIGGPDSNFSLDALPKGAQGGETGGLLNETPEEQTNLRSTQINTVSNTQFNTGADSTADDIDAGGLSQRPGALGLSGLSGTNAAGTEIVNPAQPGRFSRTGAGNDAAVRDLTDPDHSVDIPLRNLRRIGPANAELDAASTAAPRSPTRVRFGNVEVAGNADTANEGTTSDPSVAGSTVEQNLGSSESPSEIRARQAIAQMNAQQTASAAEASTGPSETSNQLVRDGVATNNSDRLMETNVDNAENSVASTNDGIEATEEATGSANGTGDNGADFAEDALDHG